MISDNTRSKDLRADYMEKSARSSGVTHSVHPMKFEVLWYKDADFRSMSLRQNT
jgi:hypothetical protein